MGRALTVRHPVTQSLAAAAVALACVSGPASPALTVSNATDTTLLVLALGQDAATRYDPAIALDVEPEDERVLAPGQSRSLAESQVMEYRGGEGVVLFLYAVEGPRAEFRRTRAVSPRALRDTVYVDEI